MYFLLGGTGVLTPWVLATGAIYLTVLACNVASFVLKSNLFNIFLDMVRITSYLRVNHRSRCTTHTDLSHNRKSCFLKWSLTPSLIDLVPRARTCHLSDTPHSRASSYVISKRIAYHWLYSLLFLLFLGAVLAYHCARRPRY